MRGARHTTFTRAAMGILLVAFLACALGACAGAASSQGTAPDDGAAATQTTTGAVSAPTTTIQEGFRNPDLGNGWEPVGQMGLQYARCFTVDYYEGGYQLACLADGNRYLMVPEGAEVPAGIDEDITVLRQPASDIYLVASDSMCLFDAFDALDRITVSGIERDDWHIEAARKAMDEGTIVYGGKYRAPDYELLLSRGVRLAIESTMINHNPDVREKLIELGIPVLVELSSYEDEPLGRTEWIRLYGALCGCDERAQEEFQEQVDRVSDIDEVPSGKTVAFFYLNSNGAPVVRRPGDYVTKMIERAGGTYALDSLESATVGRSSVTLQMEQFYALTKDADVLIYNGSIDEGMLSLDVLLAQSELFADFKAVREGNVWVTDQSMYQQMMATGDIIAEFNQVLSGATGDLVYLRKLT